MPSTTPDYDFPYPIGGDPVADGASAIQALAEALEDHLQGCSAKLARATDQHYAIIGADEPVVWDPGSSSLSPEFSFGTGNESIIYTGPDRWVAFRWGAFWQSTDSGVAQAHFGEKSPDGNPGTDNYQQWRLATAPSNGIWNDAGMVWMTNGSEWELVLGSNDGGLTDDDVRPTLSLKGI